jgi:hypothetical protein
MYIYPLVISLRQTMGPSLVGRAVDCQADGFPFFFGEWLRSFYGTIQDGPPQLEVGL